MRWFTWLIVGVVWILGGDPVAAGEQRTGALPDLRIARGKGVIAEAWFADPTTRYRHFVLGSSYEAGSLVVRLASGSTRKLTLPESSVFEDRQPRLADLAVPSFDRRWLRVFTFKGGVRELSRHALPTQAANDFAVAVEKGRPSVVVGLAGGQRIRVTPGPR
jgi:hypothetical protein